MATATNTVGYEEIASAVETVGVARANAALRALTGLALREYGEDLVIDNLHRLVCSGERRGTVVLEALSATVRS